LNAGASARVSERLALAHAETQASAQIATPAQ
jgi:hypothetical protein